VSSDVFIPLLCPWLINVQAVYHGYGRHKADMKDSNAAMMVSEALK
jgi:hypothetical protein